MGKITQEDKILINILRIEKQQKQSKATKVV